MADQMTPDELRIAAEDVDNWIDPTGNAHVAAQAARNLADVIEYAEPFAAKQFAGFAATWDAHPEMVEVVRIARGETSERETPCD